MKSLAATLLLTLASLLQPAAAYSPIWNINGWDAARLKDQAGITIASWKHEQFGEDPPLDWVEVCFDRSKLTEDEGVLMTLWVNDAERNPVCCFRAEQKEGEPGKLRLLFSVRKQDIANSHLEILIPQREPVAVVRDFGDPGFAGYTLDLARIIELAGKPAGSAEKK